MYSVCTVDSCKQISFIVYSGSYRQCCKYYKQAVEKGASNLVLVRV